MLFRTTLALFVLCNIMQTPPYAAAKGTAQDSEITVVGLTESAAFIAVRPAAAQMQPQIRPAQEMTTGTLPQPATEEPETQSETMTGRGGETIEQTGREPMRGTGKKQTGREIPAGVPASTGGDQAQMQMRMMQHLANDGGEPTPTSDREMLRGVPMRMRGRRLQRRAAAQEQPSGRMESTRAITRREPQQDPMRVMERTPMQQTTMMEQPTIERVPMQGTTPIGRPTMERPMTTPETEEVAPEASKMPVRGGRYRIIGDIEISCVREGAFGRGGEPQWEKVWMPRRQFVQF